jgi:hypothetical protein
MKLLQLAFQEAVSPVHGRTPLTASSTKTSLGFNTLNPLQPFSQGVSSSYRPRGNRGLFLLPFSLAAFFSIPI